MAAHAGGNGGAVDSLHTMSWHGQGILPGLRWGVTAIPGNGAGVAERTGGLGARMLLGFYSCLRRNLSYKVFGL